jgi:hypothetical protein
MRVHGPTWASTEAGSKFAACYRAEWDEVRTCGLHRGPRSDCGRPRCPDSLLPPQGVRFWSLAKDERAATVRLPNGAMRRLELHWYEAHGIGQRDLKMRGSIHVCSGIRSLSSCPIGAMKKASRRNRKSDRDTMRPEYDFSSAVRGANAARSAQGSNLAVIEVEARLRLAGPNMGCLQGACFHAKSSRAGRFALSDSGLPPTAAAPPSAAPPATGAAGRRSATA